MTLGQRRAAEAAAVAALLVAEGVLFARNLHQQPNYDEGVYLASLDALRHGETLGSEVFASQPPGFYLVLRLIGLFSGHSITDARIGFLLVALIGCAAAYALGRAIVGVMGGLAAAGLVAILPPFPSESLRVDADVPAVSLSLVALALTAWSMRRRSPWLGAPAGAAFAFAASVKPNALLTLVPLAALLIAGKASRGLVLATVGGAATVTAAFLVAYAGVLGSLWDSVVTFHRQSRSIPSPIPNGHVLGHFLDFSTPSAWLVVLGLVAGVVAWRRTWPLWLWAIAAALFILWQRPLFEHHIVVLCAAVGAAAGTSIGRLPPVVVAAVLAAIAVGGLQQFHRIGLNVVDEPAVLRWGAEQLRACPEPVASDQPIVPFQARRRMPGQLVDTSLVRLDTPSLTAGDVLRIVDREHVHAVFASRAFLQQPAILAGLARRFGPPRRNEQARVYIDSRGC